MKPTPAVLTRGRQRLARARERQDRPELWALLPDKVWLRQPTAPWAVFRVDENGRPLTEEFPCVEP